MGVGVGDATRVDDPLLGMRQGHVLVPGCLVLGVLLGGGRGHGREVLDGGGGVPRGRGTRPIHMGEGGDHDPGRGRLLPFVERRGQRRHQWWTVRRRRVRSGSVCGLSVWVFRRVDHDVVLSSCDGEEVGAHAEHVSGGG